MLLKINFYLRVYDKFGLLVTLIKTCIKDITPFTIYLMIWELTFVMLYMLSGIKPKPRDGMHPFLLVFLFVWENSVGFILYPDNITFSPDYYPG